MFLSAQNQRRILDLFAFKHDLFPFFDDYQYSLVKHLNADKEAIGRWEYVIGTGIQWNFLIDHPSLIGPIEMNPRLDEYAEVQLPHPQLDSMLNGQVGGSLNLSRLAATGFMLELPKVASKPQCGFGKLHPQDFFGDIWDAISSGAEDLYSSVKEKLGDALKDVANALVLNTAQLQQILTDAYHGVADAIDTLRKFGNTICTIVENPRSNGGWIYVVDLTQPATVEDRRVRRTFGANAGLVEPLRNMRVHARGGIGGLLLVTGETDSGGFYQFDNLCGSVDYNFFADYDSPAGWVTTWGLDSEQDQLGSISSAEGTGQTTWVTESQGAEMLMGAQLGQALATEIFGFTPIQAKIAHGDWVDEKIGSYSDTGTGPRHITSCGQIALAALPLAAKDIWNIEKDWFNTANSQTGLQGITVPGAFIGGLIYGSFDAAKVAALSRSDIFMMSNLFDSTRANFDPIGVMLHEYGHYTVCRAIAQLGSEDAFREYINDFTGVALANKDDNNDFSFHPLRNTGESLADYFSYQGRGYTNYFQNNTFSTPFSYFCSRSQRDCLAPDASFALPANHLDNTKFTQWIGSRASVMYDWTAAPNVDGDALGLASDVIARAVVNSSPDVYTQNMSLWISRAPDYGHPSDRLCTVYTGHGWDCSAVDAGGAQLSAPANFNGFGLSTTSISWSWAPTSRLTTSYDLLNFVGGQTTDVASIGATGFSVVQDLPAAGPNHAVLAAVEAMATGALPGRSARRQACTLAAQVKGVTSLIANGLPDLRWKRDNATQYIVLRSFQGVGSNGSFQEIARLSADDPKLVVEGDQFLYTDTEAAPGSTYIYRIDAVNCSDQPTIGIPGVKVSVPFDNTIFVSHGSSATTPDGSRSAPFPTLSQGIGAVTPDRTRIALAEGTYGERIEVNAAVSNVEIFGGYNSDYTKPRDPSQFHSIVVGDNSPGGDATGMIRVADATLTWFSHALIWQRGQGTATFDAVEFRPGAVTGCPAGGCTRFTLGVADEGGSIVLRNVTYTGHNGPNGQTTQPTLWVTGNCEITDSFLDDADVDGKAFTGDQKLIVDSPNLIATGSSFFGSANRTVIHGGGTLDRVVVRGSRIEFALATTVGVELTCPRITNSIITAETAIEDTTGSASCPLQYIANSLAWGKVSVVKPVVVDNVFIGTSGGDVLLQMNSDFTFCAGADCPPGSAPNMTGRVVRNNFFLPATPAGFVVTAWRDFFGTGPLGGTDLNDANTWFGSSSNDVAGNFMSTARLITLFLGFEATPNTTGHIFHFRSGVVAGSAGTPVQPFGIPATVAAHDLDGATRTGPSVGPYDATNTND